MTGAEERVSLSVGMMRAGGGEVVLVIYDVLLMGCVGDNDDELQ